MESYGRLSSALGDAHDKLARYREEAARAHLLPRRALRSHVAHRLYRLAAWLEPAPNPSAPHAPKAT